MSTQPYWQARTGSGIHPDLAAYSQSIEDDRPYLVHDLAGSTAHVAGLHRAALLSRDDAVRLIHGLRRIHEEHEAGTLRLDPDLEDIHMNLEAALTADLGDVGRRLHTGRSRNDQVATCIVLYARAQLAALAQAAHTLSNALAEQARKEARTPWVARTHGQAAQPATIGFLLAAHAHRVQDLARAALSAVDAVGESPLGSGAVAGSTLPLDPAHTARLLGLRPPRSALLATGSRDAIVDACSVAAKAGLVAASLAQDLMDLYAAGALQLPDGYTTGSSLMPQKRNPDALELARGNGKGLAAPFVAVTGMVSGLGLGYQRDFQATKPHLTAAMTTARSTLELLAGLVPGLAFEGRAFAAEWAKPGLVATDVAEALVRSGVPFRTAYSRIAAAYARVESGATFADALAVELSASQLEAALGALQPDPARRATLGGPAPQAVLESLAHHEARAQETAQAVAKAQRAAEQPLRLLDQDISEILE
jgi:argininosuccinate lyase